MKTINLEDINTEERTKIFSYKGVVGTMGSFSTNSQNGFFMFDIKSVDITPEAFQIISNFTLNSDDTGMILCEMGFLAWPGKINTMFGPYTTLNSKFDFDALAAQVSDKEINVPESFKQVVDEILSTN